MHPGSSIVTDGLASYTPLLIAVAVAASMLVLLVMCVCNETKPEGKHWAPRKPTFEQQLDAQAATEAGPVIVSNNANAATPLMINGKTPVHDDDPKRESGGSRSSQSNTLTRQLPDPPIEENVWPTKSKNHRKTASCGGKIPMSLDVEAGVAASDDYDHLRQSKSPKKEHDGYDRFRKSRVSHDQASGVVDEQAGADNMSSPDDGRENIYNVPSGESGGESGSGVVSTKPVREPIYELPHGESTYSGGASSLIVRENVYAEPADNPAYHSSTRKPESLKMRAAGENVYTVVDDDVEPYAQIGSTNSGSAAVVVVTSNLTTSSTDASLDSSSAYDPYPYSTVGNTRLAFLTSNKAVTSDSSPVSVHGSRSAQTSSDSPSDDMASSPCNDEYAVVTKPFAKVQHHPAPSSTSTAASDQSLSSSLPSPPLPDRIYSVDEITGGQHSSESADSSSVQSGRGSQSHQKQQQLPDDVTEDSESEIQDLVDPVQQAKKEASYTEVTVREKLSNMQARQAVHTAPAATGTAHRANTPAYESMPENYYSTVDGGSGDGTFITRVNVKSDLVHRNSSISETYAEIYTSGGSYEVNSAPAPPTVDSLKSVIQSHSSPAKLPPDVSSLPATASSNGASEENQSRHQQRETGLDELHSDLYAVVNKRHSHGDVTTTHSPAKNKSHLRNSSAAASYFHTSNGNNALQKDIHSSEVKQRNSFHKPVANRSIEIEVMAPNHVIVAKSEGGRRSASEGGRRSMTEVGRRSITSMKEQTAPLASAESVDLCLDPGYHLVKDVRISDTEVENDPNYETLEDTKRNVKKTANTVNLPRIVRRRHDYEEVTTTDMLESAYDVRKRVLQRHVYEVINDGKNTSSTEQPPPTTSSSIQPASPPPTTSSSIQPASPPLAISSHKQQHTF